MSPTTDLELLPNFAAPSHYDFAVLSFASIPGLRIMSRQRRTGVPLYANTVDSTVLILKRDFSGYVVISNEARTRLG
jgi:hypothetical protein